MDRAAQEAVWSAQCDATSEVVSRVPVDGGCVHGVKRVKSVAAVGSTTRPMVRLSAVRTAFDCSRK